MIKLKRNTEILIQIYTQWLQAKKEKEKGKTDKRRQLLNLQLKTKGEEYDMGNNSYSVLLYSIYYKISALPQ